MEDRRDILRRALGARRERALDLSDHLAAHPELSGEEHETSRLFADWLEEEGFEELSAEAVTESWARHLMANLDEWEARGHRRVTDKFLARLEDGAGAKRGIEPHTGAVVFERDGARAVTPL